VTSDELRDRFDAALRAFLGRVAPPVAAIAVELLPLAAATEAFVLDGGKRMRPLFCYWGHRAAGGADSDEIVCAAAALELLQACALAHDDVIDDSATRRGAPAMHRQFAAMHTQHGWTGDPDRFGTAAAILLGDLALVWADAMLTGSGFHADVLQRAMPMWEAMRVEVMCGQYLDVVEQARGGGSVDRALRVARLKTAKYTVERPLHLGVALAGGPPELTDACTAYGLPIGEAFQLRDDLLGVYGDPAVTGKPAGDDLREGKRTALVAFALQGADRDTAAVITRGLGDAHLAAADVDAVREAIRGTGAVDRVEELITRRVEQALAALDAADIPDDARAALRGLAAAASERAG
jgi:geranylgeranyl diphosphate synthase type I